MVTREETYKLTSEYPIERLAGPGDAAFFDIETTGLSADKNQVYMTGLLEQSGDDWHLIQWLSDDPRSEAELLDSFFSHISRFKVLISFNGDNFDIPFLLKRCRSLGLDHSFDSIKSVDIYRLSRPCKNLLGLENCRQKSIERFLGIEREDLYSGGELINVYIQYLYTKDASLAELLLLHNADDLRGMPKILPVLSYPDLFHSELHLEKEELKDDPDEEAPYLKLTCTSSINVPVPVDIKKDPVCCGISGNSVIFRIRLIRDTLKHYFPDPEEYYYLIYEDMAVHKSVGRYVAREARRQATAGTCYVKQEGLFLPQFEDIWEPVMKTGPADKMCYALLDNVSLDDPEKWCRYSGLLLKWLAPGV